MDGGSVWKGGHKRVIKGKGASIKIYILTSSRLYNKI